jgi:hypothetical protein
MAASVRIWGGNLIRSNSLRRVAGSSSSIRSSRARSVRLGRAATIVKNPALTSVRIGVS